MEAAAAVLEPAPARHVFVLDDPHARSPRWGGI